MRPGSQASRSATLTQSVPEIPALRRRLTTDDAFPRLLIEHPEGLRRHPRRVAIGNFDGVHRGHAAIIRGCDTVLTFDPHPLAVLAPERAPKLLTSLRDKAEFVAQLGVRELVIVRFDEKVARQSPESFVQDTLLDRLGAVHVSVGDNFRYGAKGGGDIRSLAACAEFTTAASALLEIDDEVVCSTRIRRALERGDVREAARLLGRPHRLPSQVVGIDRRSGIQGDVAELRLEFQPWHACPAPGRYLCSLRPTGASGTRVIRSVEVLPAHPVPSPLPRGAQARVVGEVDPSWTHEICVEFLRSDRIRGIASEGAPVDGVA